MNIKFLNIKQEMLNRELGLIKFYKRVLAQSTNKNTPLMERLRYLCIVCKNCDELFEVRVARLLKLNRDNPNKLLPDGMTAFTALNQVHDEVIQLYSDIYNTYHQILKPQLAQQKINILKTNELNESQQKWLANYFTQELKPILTPIGIDPSHPFPRVPNKNLHVAVKLDGVDQFGRNSKIAIIEIPRILPRIIKIPNELCTNQSDCFIWLQDIISLHINQFFLGLNIVGCYPFRVTRAADLVLNSNTKNIRNALTKEIQNRKFAECSRLELDISNGKPDSELIDVLLKQFNIGSQEMFLVGGPVNLSRIGDIGNMITRPDLNFPQYTPGLPQELIDEPDLFKAMQKSDILIHTPYQSFDPVVELTKRAAMDPDVIAIKMTVYRTGADSELVQNLIKAAKLGKQVIASVELFARFDEEINVELSNQLESAGAHVVYGVMGYKVHAKMLLVIRKEDNKLTSYTHLGTGNYHQSTAKIYTDYSLLTTNQQISQDVDSVFTQITGMGNDKMLNVLYQSPFTLHQMLMSQIEQEIDNASNGQKALIIAKMNSLIEPQIIRLLYRASQAGVVIRLIVRGACALKPQVAGLSDNIQVRSIVGRFLEHHRVFYFYANKNEQLFIASADWMGRNFFKRVETCVPIFDKKIKRKIINDCLNLYWQDNTESWSMLSDGSYKLHTTRGKKVSAQKTLMNKLGVFNELDSNLAK